MSGLWLIIHGTRKQIPLVEPHLPHSSVVFSDPRIPLHPTGYHINSKINASSITNIRLLTTHVPSTQMPPDKQGVPSVAVAFSTGFCPGNMHINLQGLLAF